MVAVAIGNSNILYISDYTGSSIHLIQLSTVKTDSDVITRLPVNDRPHGLSITKSGELLVTCPLSRVIKRFNTKGELISEMQLDEKVINPWHAVEFGRRKDLIVTFGGNSNSNKVCYLTSKGKPYDCISRLMEPLNSPIRLQLIGEYVAVADENNRRILLSARGSVYVWTLLTELRGALRIWMDNSRNQLYVVVNKWLDKSVVQGDVTVYNVI
jgi:hypothetical protein